MTQYCTFALAGQLFGIEVERVQELLRPQVLTPVPTAAGAVAGLINLRGQIVTALDLRTLLGLPPLEDGRRAMTVVVRHEGSTVSFLVDEIGAVVEVDPTAIDAPPETVGGLGHELILGVHKLPDRLLSILDIDVAARPTTGVAV